MLKERGFRRSSKAVVFICAVAVVLSGSCLFAAEGKAVSGLSRHSVFSLKNISSEQGKKYLAEMKVGTVSQLPGANALLVTGRPEDLLKAKAILGLVDAEESFQIKTIFPLSQASNFPSNEQIAAEIGDISIGTFSEPPVGSAKNKVIIDTHGDSVVAIAPAGQLEKIVSTIEQLRSSEAQASEVTAEPNESTKAGEAGEAESEIITQEELEKLAASFVSDGRAEQEDSESDKLLDKLLRAIAGAKEAEKQKAETEQVTRKLRPSGGFTVGSEPASETRSPSIPPEQNLYEPAPIVDGNETLELDLPEKIKIIDLIDLVGKYLKLDYMYDEARVRGEIALRFQGPIKVKDLYPLLESALKFSGLVMTRRGNLVTIVDAGGALTVDPLLQPEANEVQYGDVVITRVFRLEHIDTASAENLLGGMKLGGDITAIEDTGTLIVTEYAHRMERIEKLLEMIDKPGEPKEFRFRQLKYTMAETLALKVKTLVEQLEAVSVTISEPEQSEPARRTRRGRTPSRRRQPTAEAEPGEPTVYLDADERTNRILMIGYKDELDIVDELIDSLDVEQQDLRAMRLYDIQYVGAEEVVKKLGELGIIGGGGAAARAAAARTTRGKGAAPPVTAEVEPLVEEPQVVVIESTNSLLVNATPEQHVQIATIISYVDSETLTQAIPYVIYPLENQSPEDLATVLQKLIQETIEDKEGKIQRTIKRTEEDIVIVPDESTFSLIVYASKKNQEWIGNLIGQLDRRRPQVLIDVSLVEITRDEEFAYDLSLISNARNLVSGNKMITGELLPLAGAGARTILEGGFNLRDSEGKFTKSVVGFYNDDRIQALLSAIDSKGYGRILAQPKVLVNDNEEGLIETTEKTYVSEETTSYTSEGEPVVAKQWKEYPAVIKLSITPNISEGDLLRLVINMVREDFEKKESAPPDYRTSNVNTTVTVPDGSTIILGGLTKLKQSKAGSKVPLLGDIPILGGLFRTVAKNDETSRLYIFVKANILRPDETIEGLAQLRRISERNKASFEEAERDFQSYQEWPGIEPEPMDPLRILGSE